MPLFIGASESYDTDAWEAYNLKKENAKLRTFIAGYIHCNASRAGCDGDCPLHRQTDDYSDFNNWCSKYTLARELGIEVD